MSVPTYDEFVEPLLQCLVLQIEGMSVTHVHEAVATRVGLSAEDRAQMLPSGMQAVYKNRIGLGA